jgi:hypothetical protein
LSKVDLGATHKEHDIGVCHNVCRDQHFRRERKERATEIEKFTDLVRAVVRSKK